MKKIIITLILFMLIILAMWAISSRKHWLAFPDVVSSYSAKEYCSCRYVVGRSAEQCKELVRQYISIDAPIEEDATKTITISGMGQTNQARYINERLGCVLLNED